MNKQCSECGKSTPDTDIAHIDGIPVCGSCAKSGLSTVKRVERILSTSFHPDERQKVVNIVAGLVAENDRLMTEKVDLSLDLVDAENRINRIESKLVATDDK